MQLQPELGVLCSTARPPPPQLQRAPRNTAGWTGWAAAHHSPWGRSGGQRGPVTQAATQRPAPDPLPHLQVAFPNHAIKN